ncbi:MAG: NAD(+) synthase [Desulfobacteraceae bacterium]|nr:NAD(+) synthase [Desulfobacteraceae bacterium]MBC2754784.1 NAD(+) synthase [Desulfobacteraceae bacterium]
MNNNAEIKKNFLNLNCEPETNKIKSQIQRILSKQLKKRGIVVGLSGGIDSSVTVALSQKAMGKDRVMALLMPELHSSDDTLDLSRMVANHFGVQIIYEDITQILEALGFYKRYNAAIQSIIPEYGKDWKSKIVTSNILESKGFTFFSVIAKPPEGNEIKKRLDLKAYLEVVAATNFKQRTRKLLEYYHADRLNYAVAGTPNRLEYDQGFFVKNGDGAADFKPIAHLYKSQVYQLAKYLGVPEKIIKRPPTTDTYSLSQDQDEFYFSLSYEKMDLCLYGKNNNIPAETIGSLTDLTIEQVQRVYKDIDQKRSTTKYLHLPPVLIEKVPEIDL